MNILIWYYICGRFQFDLKFHGNGKFDIILFEKEIYKKLDN
jgi:hypothetical protein